MHIRPTFYYFNPIQCYNQVQQNIQIVAGTFEILKLGPKHRDIYLQLDNVTQIIGVAHLIWKLLYNTVNNHAIVFISINNPHATTCEQTTWCADQCLNDNSPLASFKDPWTGCIICCSYEDAKKKIKDMPNFDNVDGVLRFYN